MAQTKKLPANKTPSKAKSTASPSKVLKPAAAAAPKSTAKSTSNAKAESKPAAKAAMPVAVKPKAAAGSKPAKAATKAAKPAEKAAEPVKIIVQKPIAATKPAVAKPAPVAVAASVVAAPPVVAPVQAARAMPAAVAKPAARTSPPMTPKDLATRAAQHRQATMAAAAQAQAQAGPVDTKKPISQRHGFKTNEYVVYPAHGVGRIVGIEEQEIAGMSLELFVITFDKDKMTLRVPTGKQQSVGMRKLSDEAVVTRAMETLKGRARIKRTMWSRRAQEYEAKINSGDLVSIAEVVRDLYRSEAQPEQSYSERQLYEAALDRMAREIAAVDKLDDRGAVQKITEVLSRSAKGRRIAAEGLAIEEAGDAEIKAA